MRKARCCCREAYALVSTLLLAAFLPFFFLPSFQFARFLIFFFFCNYGRIKWNVLSSKQRLGSIGGARACTGSTLRPQKRAFFKLCIISTGLLTCVTWSLAWARGHLSRAGSCRFVASPSAPYSSPRCRAQPCCPQLSCPTAAAPGPYWGGGLAAVGQKLYAGYQWEGIFVNLLLFNGEIEACQEDKSSRFLPLEQTQFCQPLWQYQGTGSSPQSYKQRRKSPKSCAPNGCAERPFLTPLPPKGKFPFLHLCDFNFLKPPSSPPPWPSSAALVPALLGSVPRRAQPHLPPRSHGISLGPRFCVIHFWDHRCYSKLMDSLRAVQWLA